MGESDLTLGDSLEQTIEDPDEAEGDPEQSPAGCLRVGPGSGGQFSCSRSPQLDGAQQVPGRREQGEDDDGDILLLDDSLLASEPEPEMNPEAVTSPSEPPTNVLLQQVLDALAAQSSGAPCAPAVAEEGGEQHQLLRQVLTALSNPASPPPSNPMPVAGADLEEANADDEGDDDVLILDDSLEVAPPPPPSPMEMPGPL